MKEVADDIIFAITKSNVHKSIWAFSDDFFDESLSLYMDQYIAYKFKLDYPEYMILESRCNMAKVMDIKNGTKYFIAFFKQQEIYPKFILN